MEYKLLPKSPLLRPPAPPSPTSPLRGTRRHAVAMNSGDDSKLGKPRASLDPDERPERRVDFVHCRSSPASLRCSELGAGWKISLPEIAVFDDHVRRRHWERVDGTWRRGTGILPVNISLIYVQKFQRL